VPLNPTPAVYGPSTPTNGNFRSRAAANESAVVSTPFSPTLGDYSDSPGSKSWATRERVKAATCVSFSPDGKYLAVGETGYRPRVLIFSTSKESSPDCPLTCLPDHTVGVQCVAFSPNSQYLASLGTDRDGFLFIWSINSRNGAATLHASNKCTNQINQIAWMGSSLISVGKRHVKVWRLDDSVASTPVTTPVKALAGFFSSPQISQPTNPKHRTLHGRNCLLGSLQECRFTAVVPLSKNMAVVCSDAGDICWLDDTDGCQRFKQLTRVSFPITAASVCPSGELLVAGRSIMKCFDVNTLLAMDATTPISGSESPNSSTQTSVVALSLLGDYLVSIDEKRAISLIETPAIGDCYEATAVLRLPAHGGAVLGVRQLPKNDVLSASFFSWSADGTILFWDADGVCKRTFQVPLEQPDSSDPADLNELKVVRTLSSAGLLITGDKFGWLR
jgi:WD40 repeat protein